MVYIDKTELNVGNVAVANLDVLSITKGIKDMGIFDPPASCYLFCPRTTRGVVLRYSNQSIYYNYIEEILSSFY
jgi:hypothetical protein